ncbi:cobalt-precorrin-5B (C(1))-methyltransferase, partial [Ameyamaea chiangmaiensis]|nr:cobalt-precorrin-5B (C(1))-methyltransferase [Ameyamaea chiangmaiensis]
VTVAEALLAAGDGARTLCDAIAREARTQASVVLGPATDVEVLIFDRAGILIGRSSP